MRNTWGVLKSHTILTITPHHHPHPHPPPTPHCTHTLSHSIYESFLGYCQLYMMYSMHASKVEIKDIAHSLKYETLVCNSIILLCIAKLRNMLTNFQQKINDNIITMSKIKIVSTNQLTPSHFQIITGV